MRSGLNIYMDKSRNAAAATTEMEFQRRIPGLNEVSRDPAYYISRGHVSCHVGTCGHNRALAENPSLRR
jgi:hypothetical protein